MILDRADNKKESPCHYRNLKIWVRMVMESSTLKKLSSLKQKLWMKNFLDKKLNYERRQIQSLRNSSLKK